MKMPTKRARFKGFLVSVMFPILFLFSSGCADHSSTGVSKESVNLDPSQISPERLALIGKVVVFGDPEPRFGRGSASIGRGQCPLCHMFLPEQRADRAPVLVGLEVRSHQRIKEERYKMFVDSYPNGEPKSGIKPHAQSGGEYILESEYCPDCYIPVGFGIKGTNDMESAMPIINQPPISLTDFEIVSVLAYIQMKDTPGDYSKVTAVKDWERYFGKKLPMTPEDEYLVAHISPPKLQPASFVLSSDGPEQIIEKMGCIFCHKIPGLSNKIVGRSREKTGALAPLLIMKRSAANRINSSEYQKAVSEGRASAKTPKEYVIESITKPDAFIVPGFSDFMNRDYSNRLSLAALDKLVGFLLEQDEAAAIRDGLDRLPNEKEGSLLKSKELETKKQR